MGSVGFPTMWSNTVRGIGFLCFGMQLNVDPFKGLDVAALTMAITQDMTS
jgi:hypothetical protein